MKCPQCHSLLDLVGDTAEYGLHDLILACAEERCGFETPLPGAVLHAIREFIDSLPQELLEEEPVEPKWQSLRAAVCQGS